MGDCSFEGERIHSGLKGLHGTQEAAVEVMKVCGLNGFRKKSVAKHFGRIHFSLQWTRSCSGGVY